MYKFNTFGTCVEVSQVQFPLILKYQELGHPCHLRKDYPVTFPQQVSVGTILRKIFIQILL